MIHKYVNNDYIMTVSHDRFLLMEQNQTSTNGTALAPSAGTIEQGAAFIGGVLFKAERGHHFMTVKTGHGVTNVRFSKDHDDVVDIEGDEYRSLLESVLVGLEVGGVIGATLRSTAGAANPEAQTEVRGWVVTTFSIRGLTEVEIMEAYSADNETGEATPLAPGVNYVAGWKITSTVEK